MRPATDQAETPRLCSGQPGSAKEAVPGPRPWWRLLPQSTASGPWAPGDAGGGPAPGSSSPARTNPPCTPVETPRSGAAREFLHELAASRQARSISASAGTPAELLLALLEAQLLGQHPPPEDVQLARTLLERHTDPYLPFNLRSQMEGANLDSDVVDALMHQLGACKPPGAEEGAAGAQAAAARAASDVGPDVPPEDDCDAAAPCGSLREALQLLLAPRQPGRPLVAAQGGEGAVSESGSDEAEGGWEARGLGPVQPPLLDEVERVLSLADSWQYDTWRLAEVTHGHALSCLGFYLLQREGLVREFRLHPTRLTRLLLAMEAGYTAAPYHNSTHAADVLQTFHVLLHGAGLTGHYLDRLGLMAAYFAAMIHDFGHPGLTADFLVASSDPLAIRYNDRAPLENHHAAAFFGMLRRPGSDALAHLGGAERAAFRKTVVDLVMATDMKQHFALLSHFNTAHGLQPYNKDVGPWRLARRPRASRSGSLEPPTDGHRHTTDAGEGSMGRTPAPAFPSEQQPEPPAPRPADEAQRLVSLQIALKAADLGHLGEELEVHKRWVRVLEEEFFRQGDREQELGLPISPLFDRTKQGVSKSQVGFYDFIALPLVHALASAFPGAQPLLACYVSNYDHWRAQEGQPQPQQAQAQQAQHGPPASRAGSRKLELMAAAAEGAPA
ncbi:hypothetical protein HYH03_009870 [Edaphochlamys debaryana]|uniref:PDEase domain-containing protein n=1 Tax=Edaphochlamys debaryana TaxID=47281 RepID=A0A835XY05_9CHLO|nr:hypothetical protein HYH03_009870 [Edaphochlamys debaryana]|eukprot:KAG2491707.1 hypothetical protein HYH03_009870 [Edaphochlamys debaryana]